METSIPIPIDISIDMISVNLPVRTPFSKPSIPRPFASRSVRKTFLRSGVQWDLGLDPLVIQKKRWKKYGKIWKNMEKYGKIWKNMEKYGKIWKNHIGLYGTGLGKCPNWTSPNYWGYVGNLKVMLKIPQKGTICQPLWKTMEHHQINDV